MTDDLPCVFCDRVDRACVSVHPNSNGGFSVMRSGVDNGSHLSVYPASFGIVFNEYDAGVCLEVEQDWCRVVVFIFWGGPDLDDVVSALDGGAVENCVTGKCGELCCVPVGCGLLCCG